jgi:hypothetical protein
LQKIKIVIKIFSTEDIELSLPETIRREFGNLLKIKDNYPKFDMNALSGKTVGALRAMPFQARKQVALSFYSRRTQRTETPCCRLSTPLGSTLLP